MPGLPLKAQCTKAQQRCITRWEHEEAVEAVQKRLYENPDAMRQRRETVEHPFGTLKMRMGATHFLMKTLPKDAGEMALHSSPKDARHEHRRHQAADGGDRGLIRLGCNLCSAGEPVRTARRLRMLPPRPKSENMLETVTLQYIPPVAVRRHPLRRVITRPRPNAVLANKANGRGSCRLVATFIVWTLPLAMWVWVMRIAIFIAIFLVSIPTFTMAQVPVSGAHRLVPAKSLPPLEACAHTEEHRKAFLMLTDQEKAEPVLSAEAAGREELPEGWAAAVFESVVDEACWYAHLKETGTPKSSEPCGEYIKPKTMPFG